MQVCQSLVFWAEGQKLSTNSEGNAVKLPSVTPLPFGAVIHQNVRGNGLSLESHSVTFGTGGIFVRSELLKKREK